MTSGARVVALRAWFALCRACGWILRSARYTEVEVRDGAGVVRKRRVAVAPALVWLSGPLMRVLDAGVRVLPQQAWVDRERLMYGTLHGARVSLNGKTIELPRLPGRSLAVILEDSSVDQVVKRRAVALAVDSLASLHRAGHTHGDAMAENVLVELDGGAARWIDFETVHDERRPIEWRRADDVRALLATSVLRMRDATAEVVRMVIDRYEDRAVLRLVVARVTPGFSPALVFHLGQAALSFDHYRELARQLGTLNSPHHGRS
jgi:hypothetical protein